MQLTRVVLFSALCFVSVRSIQQTKTTLKRSVRKIFTSFMLCLQLNTLQPVNADSAVYPLQSDELAVTFTSYVSGLVLKEFQAPSKQQRVVVSDILPSTEASNYASLVKKGFILVSAAGKGLEGKPLEEVAQTVSTSSRPLTLTFRDPRKFVSLLNSATSDSGCFVHVESHPE